MLFISITNLPNLLGFTNLLGFLPIILTQFILSMFDQVILVDILAQGSSISFNSSLLFIYTFLAKLFDNISISNKNAVSDFMYTQFGMFFNEDIYIYFNTKNLDKLNILPNAYLSFFEDNN